MALLDVNKLSIHFGGVKAVQEVSFSIDADHLGRHLRPVQGAQGAAEGGIDQVQGRPDADREQQGDHPVPVLVTAEFEAEQAEGRHRHAIGAAGPGGLVAQGDVEDDA